MIDTMKLTLDKNMFWIKDIDRFQKERQSATRGYFTLVQNPTKSELKSGIYKPRLTITKRFNVSGRFEQTLSIELSLPKLLYGNNFDELQDSDLSLIVDKLREVLKEMGVRVFKTILKSAPISTVHYSKNVPLTNGLTPHFLIGKIKEANIPLSLDINQTDYRNDGHSYKWHSNSYEVAFYDKIKDLEMAVKSDKRAIEKDNSPQLHLFQELRMRKKEVLRMEVRLNNRQKMKQLFNNLKLQNEFTLEGLFKTEIAKCILLHYLDELENQRPKMLDYISKNPKSLLAEIIVSNPNLGTLKTIQAFGLKLALDALTPRELRAMFGKYHKRSWYRLFAEAKTVQLPSIKNPFEVMRKNLIDFVPLKLVDYNTKMINNDKYN